MNDTIDDSIRVTTVITFIDGSHVAFVGDEDNNAALTSDHRLLEAKTSTVLMLEVDGNLIIYPWSTIHSVEISPCPNNNAQHIRKGLQRTASGAK